MSLRSHQEIDRLATGYGQDFTPDVEKGLARLHRNIDGERRQAKVRRLRLPHWLSIAAGVLLLFTAGFFLLSSGNTTFRNDTLEAMAVELPDGTEVILQRGSSLSFGGAYAGAERRVEIEGQGYFNVVKDADKPFLVSTGKTTLRVTGTAFNLRVEGEELEVEVSEGSIVLDYGDREVSVAAKQCGISKSGELPTMVEAPNLNRHAWRTGHLVFENAPVAQVLATLHNNWDVEVDLPTTCDYPISATFNKKDAAAILETVAKLGGMTCTATGKNTFAFVGGCDTNVGE
ncbi:FecR family protein [Neolewinella antarctica]|uniref:Transmembrane sensor n=1 Tax=Neolewinella antarctica TaxID=442734 RepID=A0ABX0X696_9BACT|nr:FecR domain-containing protein [Neolewinella antarctica]NJC24605.1 transmembrane sensor [Neolewinella antarctica]